MSHPNRSSPSRSILVLLLLWMVIVFSLGVISGIWLRMFLEPSRGQLFPVVGTMRVGNAGTLPVLAPVWKQPASLSTFHPGWVALMTFQGTASLSSGGHWLSVPISEESVVAWRLSGECTDQEDPNSPVPHSKRSLQMTVFAYQTGGLAIDEPLKMACPVSRPMMSVPERSPCSPSGESVIPSSCSASFFLDIRADSPSWTITVLGLVVASHPPV